MKVVFSMILGLLALAVIHVTPATAAPPLAAFARLPAIEQAVISPDGSRVALLGGPPGERTILLAPVDGQKAALVKLGQAWVENVRWVSDEYLVVNFSMLDKGTNYANGQEWSYQVNRNIVLDREGKLVSTLLADANWSAFAISQPILGVLDGTPPTVLIQGLDLSPDIFGYRPQSMIEPKGDDLVATIWAVDITTGRGRIAQRGNRMTQGWELDAGGEARVRWDYDGELDALSFSVRPKGKSAWNRMEMGPDTRLQEYLGYSDPDDSVYLLDRDKGEARLLRRRLTDGSVTPVPLTAPARDLQLLWDIRRTVPVAVITGSDRRSYQWLDPQLGAVQAKLARAFAGRNVALASWSADRTRVVARVDAPASPPAWFLFDVRTNQASPLGESYPELAGATFGTTSWITYKARDGLEIPAYLTLPPGLAAGAKPPLIVMPHGGPAARDEFAFDWWVQALATRGYAVLQPQFRGSAGFGIDFEDAGHRQWGGKMQEDLIDGVLALAERGIADRRRVCIVGASYGGYAAMFGAAVYPSVYRCGVSVNGVSDLALLIGSKSRAFGRDTALVHSLETMMGDPRAEAEAFRLASPVFRVTNQAAPILLIHGEDDTTVPIQQSRSMQRALRAVGQPVDLVVLPDDDHHLSSTASRTKMLESLFAFLDRHLPVAR